MRSVDRLVTGVLGPSLIGRLDRSYLWGLVFGIGLIWPTILCIVSRFEDMLLWMITGIQPNCSLADLGLVMQPTERLVKVLQRLLCPRSHAPQRAPLFMLKVALRRLRLPFRVGLAHICGSYLGVNAGWNMFQGARAFAERSTRS